MKQEFSTSWLGSVQPRKQRKYRHNAPLHIKAKFLSAHLSDALQEKLGRKTATIRKGDEVVVMRGTFKKKNAKVSSIDMAKGRVYLENIVVTKKDGTKVEVPIQPSNVQIITLVEDKMRFAKSEVKAPAPKAEAKPAAKPAAKKEAKK